MTEPMTAERRAEIRERIEATPKGIAHPDLADLLAEVDRLRALWAAVAKDSRERKAEADGRRQHNQRLEDELATRTAQLDRRDAEIADLKAQQLTEATAARKNIGRWTGQVKAAEAERDQLRRALELIGTRCESFTGPDTCVDDPGRSPQGKYLADRWCDGCISRTALNLPADSKDA